MTLSKRLKPAPASPAMTFAEATAQIIRHCFPTIAELGITGDIDPLRQPTCGAAGDLGLTDYLTVKRTDGTGYRVDNPRFYRLAEDNIARLQRQKARQTPGSRAFNKTKSQIREVHERVSRCRRDHQQKLVSVISSDCVEYTGEKLVAAGLKRLRNMGKSISDAGFSQLCGIQQYTSVEHGCDYQQVPSNFPSSKKCSNPECAFKHDKLPLKIRTWTCPACGAVHDREECAAENMLLWRIAIADPTVLPIWRQGVPSLNTRQRRKKSKTVGGFKKIHTAKVARKASKTLSTAGTSATIDSSVVDTQLKTASLPEVKSDTALAEADNDVVVDDGSVRVARMVSPETVLAVETAAHEAGQVVGELVKHENALLEDDDGDRYLQCGTEAPQHEHNRATLPAKKCMLFKKTLTATPSASSGRTSL